MFISNVIVKIFETKLKRKELHKMQRRSIIPTLNEMGQVICDLLLERTEMTELAGGFRNYFSNAPKKGSLELKGLCVNIHVTEFLK
jgi:hypothetical protein